MKKWRCRHTNCDILTFLNTYGIWKSEKWTGKDSTLAIQVATFCSFTVQILRKSTMGSKILKRTNFSWFQWFSEQRNLFLAEKIPLIHLPTAKTNTRTSIKQWNSSWTPFSSLLQSHPFSNMPMVWSQSKATQVNDPKD